MIQLLSVGRSLSRVNADSSRYTMAASGSIPKLLAPTRALRSEPTLGSGPNRPVLGTPASQSPSSDISRKIPVEAVAQPDAVEGFNVQVTTVAASKTAGQVTASESPAGQTTLFSRRFRPFIRRWFSCLLKRETGSESRVEKVRVIRNDLTEVEVEIIPGQRDSRRGFLGQPSGQKGRFHSVNKNRSWLMARVFQGGPARL